MSDAVVFEHITKRYPGTTALDDVSLSIAAGEIHAVVGANGAGKSTLMHILGGTISADAGTVYLGGRPVTIRDPHHARQLGVGVVYQELRLCDNMTVAENLYLGREDIAALGYVNARASVRGAAGALAAIQADIDPAARVRQLPLSQKQLVEIAKAIDMNCRVLILDEPTSSLTIRETQVLFERLRALRADGVAVIFISHRLEEIFSVADRISILRDGKYLGTYGAGDISRDKVVELIAGRSLAEELSHRGGSVVRSEVALEVRGLTREPAFREVSFSLHAGEILGLYGLQGAGRTEVLEAIAGLRPAQAGSVHLQGKPLPIHSPSAVIAGGVAMVPEDRRRAGLFLTMDVKENICIAIPRKVSRLRVLLRGLVTRAAAGFVRSVGIKVTSLSQKVATLSGGNQQKVVLSRWLATEPKVLLLDEVTRGIDVGAKAEIYRILKKLREDGLAILMVSSELPEILAECDRTLVMWNGRLVADIGGESMSKETVLSWAMGLGAGGSSAVQASDAGGTR